LLTSLVFGYFFLWTIAPEWPPEQFLASPLWLPLSVAGALAAGWWASRRALTRTRTGSAAHAWLWFGVVLGMLAGGGFFAIALIWPVSPDSHAYAAAVTALAGYGGAHAMMAGLWCGYVLLRCRHGFVSPRRCLDLQVLRLWWAYTSAAGGLILVCLYLAPGAFAP